MENKLLGKLKISPDMNWVLLNAPDNAGSVIGSLPGRAKAGPWDAVLLFARNSAELHRWLPEAVAQMVPDGPMWVLYPKAGTGIPTDLKAMQAWAALEEYGLHIVSSAGVDATWTAVRVRPKGRSKPSGLCMDDLPGSPYAAYIDVVSREVRLPEDLLAALSPFPDAKAWFEQLSFTNKKEYVLWILTAKQEKTRRSRLEKAVEQLRQGKPNPSAK